MLGKVGPLKDIGNKSTEPQMVTKVKIKSQSSTIIEFGPNQLYGHSHLANKKLNKTTLLVLY